MDILIWPSVVIILGIFFLFLFRRQIAELINRIKKIGKIGLETYETQPHPPKEEKKELMEFYRSFESPLIKDWETIVNEFLKSKKIETSDDREKALLRLSAQTYILLYLERVYGSIWASQVACLRYLNSKASGVNISEIKPFYETAKNRFPANYQNYPIETWIGFLKGSNLVKEENSQFLILIGGREFLKYLAEAGKPELFFG
jgi:hypothetical protein